MTQNAMSRAALQKRLTTKPSDERIALILSQLMISPSRLLALRARLTEPECDLPLGAGERSFKRDVTHLTYCAERGTDPIFLALILPQPAIPRIHAERDWGALMQYEAFSVDELLTNFQFQRRALLRILRALSREQWDCSVQREGVKRSESVYHWARGMCLHEASHLDDLSAKVERLRAGQLT